MSFTIYCFRFHIDVSQLLSHSVLIFHYGNKETRIEQLLICFWQSRHPALAHTPSLGLKFFALLSSSFNDVYNKSLELVNEIRSSFNEAYVPLLLLLSFNNYSMLLVLVAMPQFDCLKCKMKSCVKKVGELSSEYQCLFLCVLCCIKWLKSYTRKYQTRVIQVDMIILQF